MQREFTILLPEEVEQHWQVLRKLLEPAVQFANGEFEIDDILYMVEDREVFVAVVKDVDEFELAMVGQVVVFPRKKILNILLLGGRNLKGMMDNHLPALKEVAKVCECQAIRGYCRPAIERLFKRIGGGANRVYAVLETGV